LRLAFILILLLVPTLAEARCTHPGIPWVFGSKTSSTGWITEGSVCTSTNFHPENIGSIEIVSKPRNGIAGKSGLFGVAYKPNPGFKGSDAFTYAVTSNAHYRRGAGLVAYITVYVISQ
jgi:hypothetical protein